MRKTAISSLLAAALSLAGAVACSSETGQDLSAGEIEQAISAPLVYAPDVVDWVSYADHVVVVTVTAERDVPNPHVEENGEGVLKREVTLTTNEVLWSRPGFAEAPKSIQANAPGSIVRDGEARPFTIKGSSRLELGSSYIMAIFRMSEYAAKFAADDWNAIAVLPYQDGKIGQGESKGGTLLAQEVLSKTQGKPASFLADLLARTPPDPVSLKYLHLDAPARYTAVQAELATMAPR